LVERALGLVTADMMPSVASVYHRELRMRGALFIAISQSGRSPDLLAATAAASNAGAVTLGVVNDASSPLADECDLIVDISAGEEKSVAATKSVLATLAAALAVVDAWASADAKTDALPQRLRDAAVLDWSPLEELLANVLHIFTIGRGPALGIAQEAGLKLAETCGIAGLAYSAAELVHGPMALAGPDFPAFAFLQDDASKPYSEQMLAALAARGTPVLVAGGNVQGATALPMAAPLQSDADLLPALLRFYLAAEAAARSRGLDPDNPPSLQKVTRTV
jgi:glucosamine--fructose-6-phosphate aminotransferase (isomerizing)